MKLPTDFPDNFKELLAPKSNNIKADFKELESTLLCSICLEIPYDVLQCDKCRKCFCRRCIHRQDNARCPIRCQNSQFKPPEREVSLIYDILPVNCTECGPDTFIQLKQYWKHRLEKHLVVLEKTKLD